MCLLCRNPGGRTGLKGRGRLGRWGPNHAADPIVTRWMRNEYGQQIINLDSNKPILEFVGIQRRDSGQWAIPGGMVDAGEDPEQTAPREFLEEAMNSESLTCDQLQKLKLSLAKIFQTGQTVRIYIVQYYSLLFKC